ncbi:MAG: 8-amino-7-oxononanoate synthase [Smithella sp.]
MFTERYQNKLINQKQAGLYRTPPEVEGKEGKFLVYNGRPVLNFASNDYLGLGNSEEIRLLVSENFRRYGASSSSSRLVSGNYTIINQAERAYADFFGYEDALFFPSGYQANLGVLSTLFEKGDTIIFDKHIHASSVKGMLLSQAQFHGYKHNNMDHLRKRLEKTEPGGAAVLAESLFSMDGDILDVDGFGKLKRKYGFFSVIDEAHSFGVLGEKGRGLGGGIADVAIGTFGKAFGLFGAFVLLAGELKEYLFNFASPLIYTTTLPEAHAASALNILDIISRCDDRRENLRKVSHLMREGLRQEGFQVTGDAHIIALTIGEENKATAISRKLLEEDIFVLPARYPTVPAGKAILRISLTAVHRREDIDYFIDKLKKVYEKQYE